MVFSTVRPGLQVVEAVAVEFRCQPVGTMRVAVAGCCHGELDKIYETLALAERRGPGPVDLLLCCGDFQAVRNEADLRCMAVPPKYRHMQTFYR